MPQRSFSGCINGPVLELKIPLYKLLPGLEFYLKLPLPSVLSLLFLTHLLLGSAEILHPINNETGGGINLSKPDCSHSCGHCLPCTPLP